MNAKLGRHACMQQRYMLQHNKCMLHAAVATSCMPAELLMVPTAHALLTQGEEYAGEAAEAGEAPAAEEAPPGSRPGSAAAAAAAGSRPGSGAQAPAASSSRPGSGQVVSGPAGGSRPASARPTSARPGSAASVQQQPQPGSAQGSRPGSGSVAAADVAGRPGSTGSQGRPTPVPEDAPLSIQGSRPLSSQSASPSPASPAQRPGSGASASASAAPSSRPPSQPAMTPPSSAPAPVPAAPAVGLRPMSREGPGATAAARTDVAVAQKVQHAEQAGYVVAGLRAIDVEIAQGPGLPHRMVRVLLDYSQQDNKPYMGGFRNKRSGVVYHHAVTQVRVCLCWGLRAWPCADG